MIFEREKHRSAAPYMCPSRVTDKPGTRPDWESNLQPFGVWDDAPNHWATRPGLWQTFTAHLLCARPWGYGQSKTDKMTFKRSRPDAGRMQKRPLPTVGCLPELSRAALGDQRLCCNPTCGCVHPDKSSNGMHASRMLAVWVLFCRDVNLQQKV